MSKTLLIPHMLRSSTATCASAELFLSTLYGSSRGSLANIAFVATQDSEACTPFWSGLRFGTAYAMAVISCLLHAN
jgi:hypothetical protein